MFIQDAWFVFIPHPLALLMHPAWASEMQSVPPMIFRVSNSESSESENEKNPISCMFDVNTLKNGVRLMRKNEIGKGIVLKCLKISGVARCSDISFGFTLESRSDFTESSPILIGKDCTVFGRWKLDFYSPNFLHTSRNSRCSSFLSKNTFTPALVSVS